MSEECFRVAADANPAKMDGVAQDFLIEVLQFVGYRRPFENGIGACLKRCRAIGNISPAGKRPRAAARSQACR